MEQILRNHFAAHYLVDIVFCIDTTKSMQEIVFEQRRKIDSVKESIHMLYGGIARRWERSGSALHTRLRLIKYGDIRREGFESLQATEFFYLPWDVEHFDTALSAIDVSPQAVESAGDGLEALAVAIQSDWSHFGRVRRLIVVYSDSAPNPLGAGARYLGGFPENMDELKHSWDSLVEKYGTVLLLIAPDEGAWKDISDKWDNILHIPFSREIILSEFVDISEALYEG